MDLVRSFSRIIFHNSLNIFRILKILLFIYISEAGSWTTLELLNIPWRDDFLDLNSEAFKKAKYIIERSVSW